MHITRLASASRAAQGRPLQRPQQTRATRIGPTRHARAPPPTKPCLATPALSSSSSSSSAQRAVRAAAADADPAATSARALGDRVAAATALYEQAWSTPGGDALLEDLVASDHAQIDAVWQRDRIPSGGRAGLRKGMRHMRRIYPDLAFTVVQAAASEGTGDVFVEWALSGTWEGRAEAATGLSLLSFDGDGRIAQTRVYRQALDAEVQMAKRGVRGSRPVEQGVLLE